MDACLLQSIFVGSDLTNLISTSLHVLLHISVTFVFWIVLEFIFKYMIHHLDKTTFFPFLGDLKFWIVQWRINSNLINYRRFTNVWDRICLLTLQEAEARMGGRWTVAFSAESANRWFSDRKKQTSSTLLHSSDVWRVTLFLRRIRYSPHLWLIRINDLGPSRRSSRQISRL